jgi:hypothetical protein
VDPTGSIGQLLVASTTAIIPFTYFGNLSKIRFTAAVAGRFSTPNITRRNSYLRCPALHKNN